MFKLMTIIVQTADNAHLGIRKRRKTCRFTDEFAKPPPTRNGPARGWRLCEFICEPTLHFSGVFSLPIAFQDKLSLFETKLISCHGFSNSRYFAKKFRISATQKKSEHIYNSHQFEHLSHVFEAILFRSMFINKGFLVILRVSTFF